MPLRPVVQAHAAGLSRSMGPHVRQVIPSAVQDVDPFVFLDHFGPFTPPQGQGGVGPHPHAGIATVTYLYAGENFHQDSLGNRQAIHLGDLAWMTAGRGIIHAEGMGGNATPQAVHGLQFWVSLPAKDKFINPGFQYLASAGMPQLQLGKSTFKVLAGTYKELSSPLQTSSPLYLYDVRLAAGEKHQLQLAPNLSCGVYVVAGEVQINGTQAGAHTMLKLGLQGDVELMGIQDSIVAILGGEPLGEPIVAYASFVMNSMEQIQQVVRSFQAGEMGSIAGY